MVLDYPIVVAKIRVTDATAEVLWSQDIPKGLVGGKVLIEYADDLWNDLNKTVVFRGAVTRDVLDNGGEVIIPADVLSRSGINLYVGIYGTNAEKNMGVPTFWAKVGVIRDAADPDGDPAADPALPVWAGLLERTPDWDALPGTDNYILNRTHWKEIREVDCTFDGNLTGREYIALHNGYNFVRVSDAILGVQDFVGATATAYEDGETGTITISEDYIEDLTSEGIPVVMASEYIISIQSDFVFYGYSLKAGTYFLCITEDEKPVAYIMSLSCLPHTQEVFHPLDRRYTGAEWLAKREDGREIVLEQATQPFSNTTPRTSRQSFQFKLESGQQYEVYWDGDVYICTAGQIGEEIINCAYIGNAHLLDEEYPDTGEPFCIASVSILIIHLLSEIVAADDALEHSIRITAIGKIRKRLPFDYLPQRYVFPSDFQYTGVVQDELEQAYFHMMSGGEVYANYSSNRFKVLMIDLDIWDSRFSNLVMTDGKVIMMWSQETGWLRQSPDSFMLNSSGKKYRISINGSGELYTTDVTNQTIYP